MALGPCVSANRHTFTCLALPTALTLTHAHASAMARAMHWYPRNPPQTPSAASQRGGVSRPVTVRRPNLCLGAQDVP